MNITISVGDYQSHRMAVGGTRALMTLKDMSTRSSTTFTVLGGFVPSLSMLKKGMAMLVIATDGRVIAMRALSGTTEADFNRQVTRATEDLLEATERAQSLQEKLELAAKQLDDHSILVAKLSAEVEAQRKLNGILDALVET